MAPKRILLIIESSETGGAETVFAEIAARLDRRRFTPHVALLSEGWLSGRLRSDGLNPTIIPVSAGGLDLKLLRGIRHLVQQLDIEIVHSHLFTTNVYASAACAFSHVPVVSTFHGTMDVEDGDRAKRLKWSVLNRFSRRTVFVSQYLRDHFVRQRLALTSKTQVIYNGTDTERFEHSATRAEARASLGLTPGAFVIGCVGDLRVAKDYSSAIRAAGLVHDQLPHARMIIAGSKTELLPDLLKLRDSLGLSEVVDFIGFQPDVAKVLPAFDVYLSSSVSEGFSLTVVEAMAAGLPVVATRSGGPEEIVRDGETGLLVEVGSPSAIADAILGLQRDEPRARAFADAGARLASKSFSITAMLRAYEGLFDEVSAS